MDVIWNIIIVGGPLYAILVQCIFGYARRGLPYFVVTGPTTVIGTCIGWYLVLLVLTRMGGGDPSGSAYLLMGYIMMANLLIIMVTTVLLMIAVIIMGRRLNTRP